jgi:hypothetical protein
MVRGTFLQMAETTPQDKEVLGHNRKCRSDSD